MRTRRTLLAAILALTVGATLGCTSRLARSEGGITLLKVATLGSHGGAGAIPAAPPFIARDHRGRYFVTMDYSRGSPPFVYDSAGRFLRMYGGEGDGPGEFRRAGVVAVGPGDTLKIFDSGRLDVFSPDDSLVRIVNGVPHVNGIVGLRDGNYVFSAPQVHPPNSLVLYDSAYHRVADFAPVHVKACAGCIGLGHVIAPSRFGGVWAASAEWTYTIELWDSTGSLVRSFSPHRAWFPPYTHDQYATPDSAPSPEVTGIWEGSDGNVWTTGMTAAAHWAEGLGQPKVQDGIKYYPVDNYAKTYDLMIDEIDPDSGTVLVERRFPELGPAMVIQPGLIGAPRQDDDGWWYIDVYYVMTSEGHD